MRVRWIQWGLIIGGCLAGLPTFAQFRGELLQGELADEMAFTDLIAVVAEELPEVPPFLWTIAMPARRDIQAYRLEYGTIDAFGNPTVASMLMVVPAGFVGSAPMVAYHHGTVADDASVPSNLGFEAYIGYGFAADGYVMVMPDYLGFGASPIPHHPYVHAATEASAAIDAMRAARTAGKALGINLFGQVFLSGYSQGGHACVATMREIEAHHRNEFNLVMTAAGSGPYDLSGVQARMALENGDYPTPGYFPFLMLGYQDIYGTLYDSPSDVLVPPYDEILPPVYDRVNTMGQANRLFPDDWRDVIQPDFLEDVAKNPFNPLTVALRKNSLLDFVPQTDLYMHFCTGDTQVDYRNTLIAWLVYKVLYQSPANVLPVWLGAGDHTDCAPFSLILGKLQMDARRTR